MILGREPAVIIGTIATILVGIVATLTGNGFISDVAAGKATDIINSAAQLLLLLAPLLAGLAIRQNVTPTAAPTLPTGTVVNVEGTDKKTVV